MIIIEQMFERAMKMGEYLPGDLHDRLKELREAHGIRSQYRLADKIGVNRSTYSRLESGETKTISSDILIKLSELYNVPTDYILGLTDTPEKTGYDIRELGLTVEAAKVLYMKKVDRRVVNELLINEKFEAATRSMASYFSDSIARMIQAQNEVLDNSFSIIDGLIRNGKIPNDREMRETKKTLKMAKLPSESFEITKIERQLTLAVREVKNKMVDEVAAAAAKGKQELLNYEIMERVKEEAYAAPGIKDLTEEERLKVIKNTILAGLKEYVDVDAERIPQIEPMVEQIALLLIEVWKENNEQSRA
ncbi:MAG: helix-turn-helix domain-containing protein [Lachnospiraceae bacterium]|nr:helix-turn-helix domain-containing protein [Lachnospiraceae bacterium]